MNNTLARIGSTDSRGNVLESSVTLALFELLGREPVGLAAAGIDPTALLLAMLGKDQTASLPASDPTSLQPLGAKRKAAEEDADEEDEETDDDAADEEEDEEDDDAEEDEDDLDEDEDEEEDEDEDEEEDDEFDDPDDDDDYDEDDDEEDFDDE